VHGSERSGFHDQRFSSVAKAAVSLYHGDSVQCRCSDFNDMFRNTNIYSDLRTRAVLRTQL
jgi:hypothetical protein